MYYTYSIKNLENGKFYIGSRTAKCMLTRKPEDDLGVKYFSSSKDKELRQAIKDGKVKYTILKEYDDATVCWRAEQQLIALYWKFFGKDMSYNHSCVNCNGEVIFSTSGTFHSVEHRKKLSEARKGSHHTDETKVKISEANKGKHYLSEESRKKLSESHKDIPKSVEHRKKLSESHKGKPKQKFYWQAPSGEIKEMAKNTAKQHHPNWILIGTVE